MVRFSLQVLMLVLLVSMGLSVHAFAKFVVSEGYGLVTLASILIATPFLAPYLDR